VSKTKINDLSSDEVKDVKSSKSINLANQTKISYWGPMQFKKPKERMIIPKSYLVSKVYPLFLLVLVLVNMLLDILYLN